MRCLTYKDVKKMYEYEDRSGKLFEYEEFMPFILEPPTMVPTHDPFLHSYHDLFLTCAFLRMVQGDVLFPLEENYRQIYMDKWRKIIQDSILKSIQEKGRVWCDEVDLEEALREAPNLWCPEMNKRTDRTVKLYCISMMGLAQNWLNRSV